MITVTATRECPACDGLDPWQHGVTWRWFCDDHLTRLIRFGHVATGRKDEP